MSDHDLHASLPADADLDTLRARIEAVDHELVELLALRVELARRIGLVKQATGTATLDPAREAAVLRDFAARARERGLNGEEARAVFWTVIGMCRRAQTEAR